MGIMHLTMNLCEEVLGHDLMQQGSGDSASSGEQSLGQARGSGVCVRERPVRTMLPCPRCQSVNTKFCYYNNYSVNQPRHFCRNCQRYWTVGGTLRNVPVGGGSRKKMRTRQRNDDPRSSLLGAGLVNMTLQSSILLPNTIQMETTQQQVPMLSQVTGCKIGSYSSQLLQSGSTELSPNTNLPTFLQFSNLEHCQNETNAGGLNKIATAGFMGFQDLQSTLHSAMYELPSSTAPTANIQLGGNNHAAFSNQGGYYTPQKVEANNIEFLSSIMHKPGYWGA